MKLPKLPKLSPAFVKDLNGTLYLETVRVRRPDPAAPAWIAEYASSHYAIQVPLTAAQVGAESAPADGFLVSLAAWKDGEKIDGAQLVPTPDSVGLEGEIRGSNGIVVPWRTRSDVLSYPDLARTKPTADLPESASYALNLAYLTLLCQILVPFCPKHELGVSIRQYGPKPTLLTLRGSTACAWVMPMSEPKA